MHVNRTIAGIALTMSATLLVGCGGSSSDGTPKTTQAPASGDDASVTTADGSSSGGGTDAGPVDICKAIDAAKVSAILGGEATAEEIPGGGCNFNQEDPRAPSVAFNSTTFDAANGGFDGAKSGVTSIIEGEAQTIDGVGDQAIIAVGTAMGSSNEQGGGLVQVGSTIAQVTFVQGTGLSTDEVTTKTTDLLKLAAEAAAG